MLYLTFVDGRKRLQSGRLTLGLPSWRVLRILFLSVLVGEPLYLLGQGFVFVGKYLLYASKWTNDLCARMARRIVDKQRD